MTEFYEISHNTSYTLGVPEIYEFEHGLMDQGNCPKCKASRRYPSGNLRALLGNSHANFWPDVIASGDYPCFIVSHRFVNALRGIGSRLEVGGTVMIIGPNSSGLSLDDMPHYFWIDGKQHFAAKMNFEASGFVDVQFCEVCGNRTDNISLTYRRQHSNLPPPITFKYDTNSGFDLFTTDLAPTAFFCSDRILECARQHKLTNIAFCPINQGVFAMHECNSVR